MGRREFFAKNGYWVEPNPLFSDDELVAYRQSMSNIMDHKYESGREPMLGRNWPEQTDSNGLVQINNAWWAGGVIRQLALNSRLGKIAVELLQENWIAGAGLDVLPEEPPADNFSLLDLDNVIITPHAAFWSEESINDLQISAAKGVLNVLTGNIPDAIVNPEVLQSTNQRFRPK